MLVALSLCFALSEPALELVPRLLHGSDSDFLRLFAQGATIDDVFEGSVGGDEAALLRFRAAFGARAAAVAPGSLALLRATRDATSRRTAVEQVLQLAGGWAWDECAGKGSANSSAELLFTTVAETSADGRVIRARLYYPAYPLTGAAAHRPPVLPRNASAVTAGAVARYQAALHAGDARAVAASFEPDGYFREPSGAYHAGAYSGVLANFRSFFALGHGGGIALDHCAVTTDGTTFVLEYTCVAWGGVPLVPSAGVAAYELGRGGSIMGARVNDNVQPPEKRGRERVRQST